MYVCMHKFLLSSIFSLTSNMKNEQFFIKVKANLTSKMEDIQMPFSQNLNLPNDYESKQINAINWLLHMDFSRLPETTRIINCSNKNTNQRLPLIN